MKDTSKYTDLENRIQKLRGGGPSGDDLLDDPKNAVKQRDFIVETFHVNKFHRDYKITESEDIKSFLANETTAYNKQLAVVRNIDAEVSKLVDQYEYQKKLVKIPDFQLSKATIEQYDASLLEGLQDFDTIELKDLFSIDPSDGKRTLDLEQFKILVNVEFKLRIQRMMKYEILKKVKKELSTINQTWTTRKKEIEFFLNDKLLTMIKKIDDIRELEKETYIESEDENEPTEDHTEAEDAYERTAEPEEKSQTAEHEQELDPEELEQHNEIREEQDAKDVEEAPEGDDLGEEPEQKIEQEDHAPEQEPNQDGEDQMNLD